MQTLADDVAYGLLSLRAKQNEQLVQGAILKLAASVSSNPSVLFEQLVINLASALRANGAFIARLLPDKPGFARTINAVIDGKTTENFDYLIIDSPCKHLFIDEQCVYKKGVANYFPNSSSLSAFSAQAYVGQILKNSAAEIIGFMFVLFRSPLEDEAFITSTIKIFAARAATELERLSIDAHALQQASLLDKAQDTIMVYDLNHRVTYWNKSAERLYGWTVVEAMQVPVDQLLHTDRSVFHQANLIMLSEGEWKGELVQRRKDSSKLVVESRWDLVKNDIGEPQSVLAINTDITLRKAAQAEIVHLAFYDPLTQLPNRQLLIDRLKQALVKIDRHRKHGSLFFIDLDNFKTLNDTLGHDVGDILLKKVGARLTKSVRDVDTVARLGGDEFVIMLLDISEQEDEAARQSKQIAEKILAKIKEVYYLNEHIYHITPSIGITLLNPESDSVEIVLKQADLAMYQAKAAGRNTIRFYDENMQKAVVDRVSLEADLRNGIHNQEFVLYYQPQLDHHNHVIGAEALIRWQHPLKGLVFPLQFIPLAEETRLIVLLGHWVLERACKQLVS